MRNIEKYRFNFKFLTEAISSIHKHFYHQSVKAINTNITIRNWIIGLYIVEYEQNGEDRAKYGKYLIDELARQIIIKGISLTTLKLSRKFYQTYPQIGQTVSDFLPEELSMLKISQTLSDQSLTYQIKPQKLLENFSFSHFTELIKLSDSHKRLFYEIECLKGSWSVRELKRQINSLYYERTGLSKNKTDLIFETRQKSLKQRTKEIIKDPFLFEFLELEKYLKINETDLENELLDHLQSFILELGNGFCFEARQKRIIIGGEYFYIDLVFYHRILKCHVLIELKVDSFKHEYLGQLNTYVSYFKKKIMEKEDNPSIGILLCTNKNQTLVEFAKDSISNHLFVSEYLVKLPKIEELQKFIEKEMELIE
ncbi:MAG: DUF1016 family protein [Candidatus Cloacimonetes bacterium]|nr:DUF1016 family protein [Candidatus Cloacimonadota bacterium]